MNMGTDPGSTDRETWRSGGLKTWNPKTPSQSDGESVQGGPNVSISTAAGEP
jgi:hypothetical protein